MRTRYRGGSTKQKYRFDGNKSNVLDEGDKALTETKILDNRISIDTRLGTEPVQRTTKAEEDIIDSDDPHDDNTHGVEARNTGRRGVAVHVDLQTNHADDEKSVDSESDILSNDGAREIESTLFTITNDSVNRVENEAGLIPGIVIEGVTSCGIEFRCMSEGNQTESGGS